MKSSEEGSAQSKPVERAGGAHPNRGKFIVTAILLSLSLPFLLEGGLRLVLYLRYGVPGKTYGLWRADKELGAVQLENGYNTIGQTNNYGFRNDEDVFDPKPTGSLRIIAYGGSSTYCYNLPQHLIWPYQLERRLRSKRPGGAKDQVLNAGGVNWSISHIIVRAKRDIPVLKPDIVLIYSGVNEGNNEYLLKAQGKSLEDLVKHKQYGVFATNLDQDSWSKRNWVTYKAYIQYVLLPWFNLHHGKPDGTTDAPGTYSATPDPYILENYLVTLRKMLVFIKEQGARPIFIIEIGGVDSDKIKGATAFSRAGAKVAAELGIPVIDPSPILSTDDPRALFSETGIHYSPIGSERFADFLYSHVPWTQ